MALALAQPLEQELVLGLELELVRVLVRVLVRELKSATAWAWMVMDMAQQRIHDHSPASNRLMVVMILMRSWAREGSWWQRRDAR